MKKASICFLAAALTFGAAVSASQTEGTASAAVAKAAIPASANQLNVVYFLGSDREPVEGYERRLSDIMLQVQQFYADEMQRNGYGYRSFGMDMKDPKTVNFIIYRAKQPASAYPYENGGGWRASQEVNRYLDEQGLRKSQHTLIIFPTFYDEKNKDMSPGGVPFYGLGKTACVLDYAHFDLQHLGKDTPKGHLLTKWLGGLAHELGHGLNLPHNREVKSEAKLGTALMGSGNYTYGMRPTFITKGSCAILDRCEVFSTDKKEVFYKQGQELSHYETQVSLSEDKKNILITLTADVTNPADPIASVNAYIEESPTAVNADYEAHVYNLAPEKEAKSIKLNFTIPIADMKGDPLAKDLLRFSFITKGGRIIQVKEALPLKELLGAK